MTIMLTIHTAFLPLPSNAPRGPHSRLLPLLATAPSLHLRLDNDRAPHGAMSVVETASALVDSVLVTRATAIDYFTTTSVLEVLAESSTVMVARLPAVTPIRDGKGVGGGGTGEVCEEAAVSTGVGAATGGRNRW